MSLSTFAIFRSVCSAHFFTLTNFQFSPRKQKRLDLAVAASSKNCWKTPPANSGALLPWRQQVVSFAGVLSVTLEIGPCPEACRIVLFNALRRDGPDSNSTKLANQRYQLN